MGLSGALALGCSGAIDAGKSGSGEPNQPGGNNPGGGNSPGGGNNTGGGNNPGGGTNTGGGTPGPGPTPVATPGLSVGASPLRRMTSAQYLNTVRDLLKMPDAEAVLGQGALPNDNSIAERFASNAEGAVKGLDADKYADAAATLASKAITNLAGLVPCTGGAQNAACGADFIAGFGRRAFRRPLTQTEVDRYKKAFAAGSDFANGIRLVVQAMLQSPKFLYHLEPVPAGSEGKILAVDSWSMASRLSYFFLNTMPDDELFAAADKGELATADQVGKAATRLMGSAKFKETARYFHDQWLELGEVRGADKDATMFPTWNEDVKTLLNEQTYKFVEEVFASGEGKASALMAGTTSYLKGALYDIYGVPKPGNANEWAKVELPGQQRGGILTHAGFMAGLAHEDRTSFILRGKVVREALLCTPVPPPPPGLNASETDIPATATARERSEKHRTEPSCAACHQLFDPVGFAFESYDAIGRYREKDGAGKVIDSVLDFNEQSGLDGHYANAVEFVKKLAGSDELAACMAKQWMRFALGREVEDGKTGGDQPSLDAGKKALKDSGKITDLLAALARSDAFRHQKVLP